MAGVTILAAFIAGLVSFLSPCVLPLVPAYLGYIAGTSIHQSRLGEKKRQLRIFINACLFVLGFIIVFALLGLLLTSVFAHISVQIQSWLSRIGGIVIILFGLVILGLKPNWLQKVYTLDLKIKPSYIASLIFGAAYAVGWTPCIGPVLGAIFGLVAIQPANAFALLLAFAFGFTTPFLIFGAFTAHASKWIKTAQPWFKHFELIIGILLILLGLLITFDQLKTFTYPSLLYSFFS